MVNAIRTMGFGVSEEIIKPDPHKIYMLRNKSIPTSCADFKAHVLQF